MSARDAPSNTRSL